MSTPTTRGNQISSPLAHVTEGLQSQPVPLSEAKRSPSNGGVPERPGFYSWWVHLGALPGLPSHLHPDPALDLELLYVGIAPDSPTSQQTLRSRVVTHIRGNTDRSTFRYSLAALLLDAEHFTPMIKRATTRTRFVLALDDKRHLSEWQEANLCLTWCGQSEPWKGTLEHDVIATMEPPLNLAENGSHPFHGKMTAARRRFREAARRNASERQGPQRNG